MENEEELFIPKTKHKGLKIILAILLIAGLIVGGYYLYQYKFNNPKEIVSNILVNIKNNIAAANTNKITDKYKIDGHIKIDSNIDNDTIKKLKDVELQFSSEADLKEKIANFVINAKYKNDRLIDIKGYYANTFIYLMAEEFYDKYLKLNLDNLKDDAIIPHGVLRLELTPSEVKIISNSLITALNKELNNIEVKKIDEIRIIDGQEINVINNYIEFKDKELNTFTKNILNNLKTDQKFVETIGKITKQDGNVAINDIQKAIDEDEFSGTYRIKFYTDKGLFKKNLVSISEEIIQNNITTSINIDKINDNEFLCSLTTLGINYSLRLKKNNSTINALVSLNMMGQYVNAEINLNYETIYTVNKPDVSKSKEPKQITEQESNEIQQKLKNNKVLQKFIEELS